ncbi:MAG: YihY/virulence factor BrkB family protein [Bacteroidota bacterium]
MKQLDRYRNSFSIFKETFSSFFEERAHLHAATISYYTLFAMIPLLYLIIVSFGRILGESYCIQVISDLFKNNIGLNDIHLFTDYIKTIHQQSRSWLLNVSMIGALLYSCSAFMVSLKHSMNDFFEIEPNKQRKINLFLELIKFRFLSLSYLALIALIIFMLYFLQVFAFSVLSSWFSEVSFGYLFLQYFFSILLNFSIITFVFKYIHDGKVSWKIASKGGLLTAFLLFFSQMVIKWYLQRYFFLGKGDLIGSIFILMAWVFYSAQVIFFGAKFTYIYGKNIHKTQ